MGAAHVVFRMDSFGGEEAPEFVAPNYKDIAIFLRQTGSGETKAQYLQRGIEQVAVFHSWG